MSRTKAVIKDEAPDYHWWTRLPNIVLSRVDDPYELALLFVIRKVAGDAEDGVCYMSIRNLAKAAKMGRSTVNRKILSLAEKGLIQAKKKKAPRGWKVWHITLPRSLWEENEEVYRELSQRGTHREQEQPSVPEISRGCPRDKPATVPEISPTKNHGTKNHITKKVGIHAKDEHGKYIDRSPRKKCPECGQYLRECICEEETVKSHTGLR